jgi:hypothetical protein
MFSWDSTASVVVVVDPITRLQYLTDRSPTRSYEPSYHAVPTSSIQVNCAIRRSSITSLYLSRSVQQHEVRDTINSIRDMAHFCESHYKYVINRSWPITSLVNTWTGHASDISAHLVGKGINRNTHVSERSLFNDYLNRRAGRPTCSAPRYDPNVAKRKLNVRASTDNATIHQRMELPTATNIEKYIMKHTKEAVQVVWPQRARDERKVVYDTNTSLFDEYKFYQDDVLSLATTHLVGCTMLVVVSRKGVFIGHYWENISFQTDKDHPLWEKYNKDQNKIFFETVIKGMRDGKGTGSTKEQDSLRLAAPKLNDEHIKAYLIRPDTNADEDGDYRELWDQMKAEAVKYMPKLGELGLWTEIFYTPVKNRRLLTTTSAGRLLFKYDAKHPKAGEPPRQSGSIVTEHRAMLWSEDNEIHNDAWAYKD